MLLKENPRGDGRFSASISKWIFCAIALSLASGCDTAVVKEARKAEADGRVINNEMMLSMYPLTYRPGKPEYLERDFEAGADFICREIKSKYRRDICSEEKINWK